MPLSDFLIDAGLSESTARSATFEHLWERINRGEEVSWGDVSAVRERWGPEVTTLVDKATEMDLVRGENLSDLKGTFLSALKERVDEMFQMFGSIPTDRLTRQPLFKARYEAEMLRRMNLYWDDAKGGVTITPRQLNDMAQQSRVKALGDVRTYLYDLADQSRFQEMARNFSPFFGAWVEGLTRWGKIAADKPLYIAYLAHLMVELPTAEDEFGNGVVVIPLPEPSRMFTGPDDWYGGTLAKGASDMEFTFQPSSMLPLAGLPGFAPHATLVAGELLMASPSEAQAVEFLFPVGLPAGSRLERIAEGFTPTWVRRMMGALDDSEQQRTIANQVLATKMMELAAIPAPEGSEADTMAGYVLGNDTERSKMLKEVRERARDAGILTAFISAGAPMSVRMLSPYAPLMNEFDKIREEHGGEALGVFMRKYGEQVAWTTGATTATRSGVGPTVESETARHSLGPLDDPDVPLHQTVMMLGVGQIGSDLTKATYSSLVSAAQESRRWDGGWERESLPTTRTLDKLELAKGRTAKANLYKERDRAILGADTAAEAQTLQRHFERELESLEAENPALADDESSDYRDDQRELWRDLRRLVFADPEVVPAAGRPDMMLLRRVMEKRLEFEQELGNRSLSFTGDTWRQAREWRRYLVEWADYPGFSEIWERFFASDMISPETRYDDNREDLWYLDR